MNEVLDAMAIFYTWDEILGNYNTLRAQCLEAINQMDLEAIHRFSQLYKFQGNNIDECKIELAHYVQRHTQFHASPMVL